MHILTIAFRGPNGIRARYIQHRLLPGHERGLTSILKLICMNKGCITKELNPEHLTVSGRWNSILVVSVSPHSSSQVNIIFPGTKHARLRELSTNQCLWPLLDNACARSARSCCRSQQGTQKGKELSYLTRMSNVQSNRDAYGRKSATSCRATLWACIKLTSLYSP